MPYLEQTSLYNQYQYSGYSPGWAHQHLNNCQVTHNVKIQYMLCPSSPLPDLWDSGGQGRQCNQTFPHYAGISGALVFQDGQTSRSFIVMILDDSLVEGDETFQVSLSQPTGGATLGALTTTTVTIVDDDGLPGALLGLPGSMGN